jgi:hypothetical protein
MKDARRISLPRSTTMLDGKAYRAHFPDDPAYDADRLGAPRQLNSAALMQALAALEEEFRTILRQAESSTD